MTDPLHSFFHPRGVALIGASSNPTRLSHGVLRNLATQGYAGSVYPVNPKGGEILGLPVYPSVAEVPDPVDLAVIMLSAERTVQALEECGRRGIRAAVLVASGFGELGAGGREREVELREIAGRYGMRFIGPNCIGVLDTYSLVNTTFLRAMLKQEVIGFASHSGAICGGVLDWADEVGVGFSRIISLGNQTDVDMADALDSLAADPHTRVATAYIEGLPDGRRFVEAARRLTCPTGTWADTADADVDPDARTNARSTFATSAASVAPGRGRKPLVVLKAGRTPSGTRAVASHTGALAGADRAFQAACLRAGAIPVENLEELVDVAVALAYQEPLPGPRVAILTNAGGPAAVGADAVDREGLRLADLSEATQARLREVCPPGTMTGNPVDMLGGARPTHYTAALEVLLESPEVDGVMVVFVPQAITPPAEIAEAVGRAAVLPGKSADAADNAIPKRHSADFADIERASVRASDGARIVRASVVCCIFGGGGVWAAARALHAHAVPHYLTPARAALGLGALWRYGRSRARLSPEPGAVGGMDPARARKLVEAAGQHVLDSQAGAEVMAAYGLSVPPSGLAGSAEQAATLAGRFGYPVALKRVAPGVVHKSDAGGVVLDLEHADAVRAAFERVVGPGERAFVQRMAPKGLEVIVGARRDAQFGPLVMFGMGGVYVEVLRDVAFRLAPLRAAEAREMVAETAAGRLLEGVRGRPPGDIEAVVQALVRVGQLMADLPQVAEVDLNPLIVGGAGEGAWAVDARIVMGDTGG